VIWILSETDKRYKVCSETTGTCYIGDRIEYNITEYNVGEVYLGRKGHPAMELVSYEDVEDYDALDMLFSEDFTVSEL